jgi:hypothetical protein
MDAKDAKFGSCVGKIPATNTFKEIVLDSGEGHAVFKSTNENHLKLWMDPLLVWSQKN